jgi:hypothetical protein
MLLLSFACTERKLPTIINQPGFWKFLKSGFPHQFPRSGASHPDGDSETLQSERRGFNVGSNGPWKPHFFPQDLDMEVSWNGGTPFAGWFISWKIPSRNGWFGGTPIVGNLHVFLNTSLIFSTWVVQQKQSKLSFGSLAKSEFNEIEIWAHENLIL